MSRPDHREPFYSLCWLGRGVTRVGNLGCFFLCWPGMVPNQRQLSIVVFDWGSYLSSLFPPVVCGILILYCCFLALQCCTFRLLLIKMINLPHAASWSDHPSNNERYNPYSLSLFSFHSVTSLLILLVLPFSNPPLYSAPSLV